jgi:hypothetical protein
MLMKAECAVCGKEGILEKRGNSVRIIHYSWVDGKRIFSRHKVMGTGLGTVGTELGTEKASMSLFSENMSELPSFNPKDISLGS